MFKGVFFNLQQLEVCSNKNWLFFPQQIILARRRFFVCWLPLKSIISFPIRKKILYIFFLSLSWNRGSRSNFVKDEITSKAMGKIWRDPYLILKRIFYSKKTRNCYRVCQGFRLASERLLFLSHFWPLLKWVVFLRQLGQNQKVS